jgi:Fe-S cluster assembly protein SufB
VHRAAVYDRRAATGVIEIFVKKGAHARYTTIQNWSRNVYNCDAARHRGGGWRDGMGGRQI